jgi:DNA-binding protein HU-beta
MNKTELVQRVAHVTKLSRTEAEDVIDITFETILKALQEGDDVRLMGFGVFNVVERDATQRRNPKTGRLMKIPPSKRVRFKAGKILKTAVK